jgi:dihydroflavonol-4-reductase
MSGSGDLALVTGAAGFLGSAVARALVGHGLKVRAMVRASSPRENLEGLDEVVEGDMRDEAAFTRAAQGARYLFHVAADYRLWARDPHEIQRNNIAGATNAALAASAAGVERVVYTSSVATLDMTHGVADETSPIDEGHAVGAYKKSKVAAERLIEGLAAEMSVPIVTVLPSTPIGPRDVRPTPTGRIIVEAATGRMPAFVDTGLNLVHVDDVAEGHWLALTRGRVGERYILGGENTPLGDMLASIAQLTGRRPPTVRVPVAPLYPLAYGAEGWALLTGKEPFLTVASLTMARHTMFVSSAKAARALGYAPRPYREGLRDALAWFRSHGYV